jgi:hypothetical protein
MKYIAIILFNKDKRALVEFKSDNTSHDGLMECAHRKAHELNYPTHIIEGIYKLLYGDID